MSGQLQPIALSPGALPAHAAAAGEEAVEGLRTAAAELHGARVLHLSSAAPTGRVPELIGAGLPLALAAGVDCEWRVLFGREELQQTAHELWNGLQGAEPELSEPAFVAYLDGCAAAARPLAAEGWDLVVLHDPGVLGMAPAVDVPVAWRCHVDASDPDGEALERALPLAEGCTGVAFPDSSFAPPPLADGATSVAPGIDPLSPRNLELSPRLAGRMARPLGVDLGRPFCCMTMRLDGWKDPHSAIDAFRLAREEVPELQLVIAALLDGADAAGWRALHEIRDYAGDVPGVLVRTSYEGVGAVQLAALERLSRVALRSALREGFGLAASEAMWKGTPVVALAGGGAALQVREGVDGYLTRDVDGTAARIGELVEDPGLAVELGTAGRQRVRDRFLVTRMVEDELRFLRASLEAA